MSKTDIQAILLHHDAAIRELEKSSAQMLIIWKAVGAAALVGLGVLLTKII
jgi:hypothetical protein